MTTTTNNTNNTALDLIAIVTAETLEGAIESETVEDLIAQHESTQRARLGGDYCADREAVAARVRDIADRLDRLVAIIRAADDGGTIQAEDMVGLFPGRPEMHSACDVRSALAAAGATADELRALARSSNDDAIEACALHQAQTWDGEAA